MTGRSRAAGWLLFVPVLVGLVVMLAAGAPLARWGVHLAVALLGWFVYLIVQRWPTDGGWLDSRWLALLAVGLMGSTLFAAGIDGVQRWHVVGPLRIHGSALLTPLLIVMASSTVRSRPLTAGLTLAACQLVHVAQPDAGQATALGLAAAWVLWKETTSPVARGLGVASALSIVVAWLRPDPLPPAAFVEDIVAVAFAVAPLLGVLALLSLLPLVLAPLTLASAAAAEPSVSKARTGLALYFAGTLVVPVWGELPVPLLGFGPSPVVGAFLGLAALDSLVRRAQLASDHAPTPPRPTDSSRTTHRLARVAGAWSA